MSTVSNGKPAHFCCTLLLQPSKENTHTHCHTHTHKTQWATGCLGSRKMHSGILQYWGRPQPCFAELHQSPRAVTNKLRAEGRSERKRGGEREVRVVAFEGKKERRRGKEWQGERLMEWRREEAMWKQDRNRTKGELKQREDRWNCVGWEDRHQVKECGRCNNKEKTKDDVKMKETTQREKNKTLKRRGWRRVMDVVSE